MGRVERKERGGRSFFLRGTAREGWPHGFLIPTGREGKGIVKVKKEKKRTRQGLFVPIQEDK